MRESISGQTDENRSLSEDIKALEEEQTLQGTHENPEVIAKISSALQASSKELAKGAKMLDELSEELGQRLKDQAHILRQIAESMQEHETWPFKSALLSIIVTSMLHLDPRLRMTATELRSSGLSELYCLLTKTWTSQRLSSRSNPDRYNNLDLDQTDFHQHLEQRLQSRVNNLPKRETAPPYAHPALETVLPKPTFSPFQKRSPFYRPSPFDAAAQHVPKPLYDSCYAYELLSSPAFVKVQLVQPMQQPKVDQHAFKRPKLDPRGPGYVRPRQYIQRRQRVYVVTSEGEELLDPVRKGQSSDSSEEGTDDESDGEKTIFRPRQAAVSEHSSQTSKGGIESQEFPRDCPDEKGDTQERDGPTRKRRKV